LEVDDRSAFDVGHIEDGRGSISLTVSAAVDRKDSQLLVLPTIFHSNLPGECNNSSDYHDELLDTVTDFLNEIQSSQLQIALHHWIE
jgi:hypothetical protein